MFNSLLPPIVGVDQATRPPLPSVLHPRGCGWARLHWSWEKIWSSTCEELFQLAFLDLSVLTKDHHPFRHPIHFQVLDFSEFARGLLRKMRSQGRVERQLSLFASSPSWEKRRNGLRSDETFDSFGPKRETPQFTHFFRLFPRSIGSPSHF